MFWSELVIFETVLAVFELLYLGKRYITLSPSIVPAVIDAVLALYNEFAVVTDANDDNSELARAVKIPP